MAVAGTLGIGASLMATDSAFAINRTGCGYDYMQVQSNLTTCWANAGTASVVLYSVDAVWGGNNAGYIWGYGDFSGDSDTTYFIKYATFPVPEEVVWGDTDTIYTVHID